MVLRLNISENEINESIVIDTDPEKKVVKTIKSAKSYWSLEGEYDLIKEGERIDRRSSWSETMIEDEDELILKKGSGIKKLPKRLWKNRIQNEIEALGNSNIDFEMDDDDDVVKISVKLRSPAPVKVGDDIGLSFKHDFEITLGNEYPYKAPKVSWNSDIYHPNISPPNEGGKLDIGYIDRWDFSDSVVDLVEEIEKILMEPGMDHKLDESTCVAASKKYLEGKFPER